MRLPVWIVGLMAYTQLCVVTTGAPVDVNGNQTERESKLKIPETFVSPQKIVLDERENSGINAVDKNAPAKDKDMHYLGTKPRITKRGFFSKLKNKVKKVIKTVKKVAEPVVKAVSKVVEKTVEKVAEPVVNATSKVAEKVSKVAETVSKVVEKTVEKVAEPVVNAASKAAENVSKVVEKTVEKVAEPVVKAASKVVEKASNASQVVEGVSKLVKGQ